MNDCFSALDLAGGWEHRTLYQEGAIAKRVNNCPFPQECHSKDMGMGSDTPVLKGDTDETTTTYLEGQASHNHRRGTRGCLAMPIYLSARVLWFVGKREGQPSDMFSGACIF
jgi:hypothetical protein